jgi:hypothetical protein
MSKAAASPLKEIAARWREARRLYSVYSTLLERYALGLPPCRELESPVDRAEPQVIEKVWNWFAQMDERVHVHQLRQLLQTTRLGNEDNLRALIQHHLAKKDKADADRDKVDFLLVQYLSSCAPAGFYDRDVEFREIAQVLQPVVGEVGPNPPAWLKPLEAATKSLEDLKSLGDLLQNGTLEKMRKLKSGAGQKGFTPAAMVAITRFNFMVRRAFVRLIAADLSAIRSCLHELESRGVKTIDCSGAQLSAHEPLENLKRICAEWKKPFRAAYAAGQNFRELVEIRAAVEQALANPGKQVAEPESPKSDAEEPESSSEDVTIAEDESFSQPSNGGPSQTAATPFFGDEEFVGSSEQESSAPRFSESAGDSIERFGGADIEREQTSTELPVETPASIAAQLFQGASSTAVTWEPVEDETERVRVEEVRKPEKLKPGADTARGATASEDAAETTAREEEDATAPLSLQKMVESISEQLTANHVKPGSVATITARDLKLLLSSWEVGAFITAGEDAADALQRIVAARALLLQQMERRKRGGQHARVKEAAALAKAEITNIQQRITQAKWAKKIDAAVNMSASCKRLQTLMSEAGK